MTNVQPDAPRPAASRFRPRAFLLREWPYLLMLILALLGVGLFPSVVAYIFWNRAVEQVGAPVAGLFVHLMPVYGVVLAWLFLGERLQGFHVIGIALILAGIWITSRKQRETIVATPE